MVDGGSLENCCTATYRGFESLSLRKEILKKHPQGCFCCLMYVNQIYLNEQYIKQQINNCSAIIFKISLQGNPRSDRDGALRSKGQSLSKAIIFLNFFARKPTPNS